MGNKSYTILTKKRHVFALAGIIGFLLILGGYFFFLHEANIAREDTFNELKAVAKLKIDQISDWNDSRLADVNALVKDPSFVQSVENYIRNSSSSNIQIIKNQLSLLEAKNIYENDLLFSAGGDLLISRKPLSGKVDTITTRLFREAIKNKRIFSSDLYYCSSENEILDDFVAPIINQKNETIAVIILRVRPKDYLYPLLNFWPLPGNSPENIIVEKNGNKVRFLSELKQIENATLNFQLPLTDKISPAVQAVLGYKGFSEGKDYFGINILAYVSPVPGTNWFLISTEQTSEAYSGLHSKVAAIVLFTALMILLFATGLIWIYHYRQKNIYKELFIKEKELREYHKEFRTILYSIGDGVLTTDTSGNIKQMNPVAEELIGLNENEALGKPLGEIFNIVSEGTRSKVENPVHKVLREGVITGLANHTILISKDGKEIPIADSAAPIRNEQGEIEGVVLVFRDKTAEYHQEKALGESQARLKRAELASKSGNWELNLTTKTMIASEGAAKIYDVNWHEMNFEIVKKFPLPEYRPMMDNALKKLIEKDEPYDIEFKIKDQTTGEIKNIHSVAYFDKEDNTLFGVIQDITERKKLEESRHQLSDIIEKSLNEIYVFDSETLKFEYINEGAHLNIGYSFEEISKLTPVDIKPEFTEETFRKAIEPLTAGAEEKLMIETIHRRKNGSTYPVEVHLQLHKLEERSVFFAIVNDITKRKRDEAALREKEAFLTNLIETIPIPVFYKDNNLKYISANEAFIKLFGFTKEQFKGKAVTDLYEQRLAQIYIAQDEALINSGGMQVYESQFKDANGFTHDVIFYKATYSNSEIENAGIIGAILDITERKKAEEEIRTILRTTIDGFYLVDMNGKILDTNDSYCDMIGYSRDELLDMGIKDIECLDDENIIKEKLKLIKSKGFYRFESKHRRKNGKIIDIDASVNYLKTENEKVFVFMRDITERKKAEIVLKESEERFRNVYDASPNGISISEIDTGLLLEVNKAYKKIYGFGQEEVIGKTSLEIGIWVDKEDRKKVVNAMLSQGGFNNLEIKFKKKDGSIIHALISGRVISMNNKTYMLNVVNDISELFNIAQALHESEERTRITLYSIGDGVISTDKLGRVKQMNPIAEQLTGWQESVAINKNIEEVFIIINEESHNSVESPVDIVLKEGKIVGLANHTLLISKDGKEIPIADSGAPIRNENGEIEGVVLVFRDQTRERETQKLIIKSLHEKEVLLKEIHHRVKNNFQKVISIIGLQSELIDDEKVKGVFDDLQSRLMTMSLIHELMYGSGDFEFVEVKNYIERLIGFLKVSYSLSDRINMNLDLESHNLAPDTLIPCGLIINEVVTNSLKYAFPVGSSGNINIAFKKIEDEYCLFLSDDGIGIKNKIDFENLSSLGLRLINLLTKQLRGSLEVFQSGIGLKFIIKFKEDS